MKANLIVSCETDTDAFCPHCILLQFLDELLTFARTMGVEQSPTGEKVMAKIPPSPAYVANRKSHASSPIPFHYLWNCMVHVICDRAGKPPTQSDLEDLRRSLHLGVDHALERLALDNDYELPSNPHPWEPGKSKPE